MRMPTEPPPVDPKVETLPQLCEEKDATLELTSAVIGNLLPSTSFGMGRSLCWNKSSTMLVGQIQNVAG